MKITTTTFGPARAVAVGHRGPYHEIGPAFQKLMTLVGQHQIPMQVMLGIYYDDPHTVAPENLRSDAAVIVSGDYELPEGSGMHIVELPEGRYAMYTHMGSYAGLGQAWEGFGPAIKQAGHSTAAIGPAFEVYMNDCSKVPEHEVRTDLYCPIT